MKAFNADPDLKETLILKAKEHRLADEYIKGTYGEHQKDGPFKACSLGCTIFDINAIKGLSGSLSGYAFLAQELDIPEFIAHLQDCIFEGLEADLATHWTERLLTSIPVGADLTPVLPVFLVSLLDGLPQQEGKVKAAIEGVKRVLVKWVETGKVDQEAARKAEKAVRKAQETGAEEAIEAIKTATLAVRAAQAASTWATTWAIQTVSTGAAAQVIGEAQAATWTDIADNLILSIQTTTKGERQ